jgi:hypothetical protein
MKTQDGSLIEDRKLPESLSVHNADHDRTPNFLNEATVWMETHRPRPQRWMMVALPQSQRIGAVGSNPTCFIIFNQQKTGKTSKKSVL